VFSQTDDPLGQVLRDTIQILRKTRINYCLIGAVAIGAWGQPRTTQDVDVLLVLENTLRDRTIQNFQGQGFEVDHEWAKHNPMIREWHIRLSKGGIPVDLMLPRDNHDLAALQRRRRKKLNDLWVFVMSPEDLVLNKLKVGRPRDFEDALSVIVRQRGHLDISYLEKWGQRLHVLDELAYLMKQ